VLRQRSERYRCCDSALSAIGAATSLLALTGLTLYRVLGWWWPDRVAGLAVAALAAAEAWRIAPWRPAPSGNRH
jgi:divalent metal cation (Fe/Co/Zn/Cd) transporter